MSSIKDRNQLANTIKGLHRKLRQELKSGSVEIDEIWNKHCQDNGSLEEYAIAMHKLATEHWELLSAANPETSRIHWSRNFLSYYFQQGGLEKERKKRNSPQSGPEEISKRLRISVLDVGSCYNPFSKFEELEVLAIDLCPAQDSVYKCDFLNVMIQDMDVHQIDGQTVTSLKPSSFDSVIFSFLLEYFPSPSQRFLACQKACRLLNSEGLLIIITPDSKAAHSNSKMMRSWRDCLQALGLRRVKYQKLQHAHCMAFRKETTDDLENTFQEDDQLKNMMYIVQDFQTFDESDPEDQASPPSFTSEDILEGFSYLPQIDD